MKHIPATVIEVAIAFCRDLGPLMIQLEMKFAHHLDLDRLARALDLLFEAEPVLGCRLAVSPFRAYWEPLGPTDRSCLTSLSDEEAFAAFRVQDLAASRGPQIQVGHLRTSGGDSLLIKITHEVCDGGGLKETAAILADLYNRLLVAPQHRPSPNRHGSRGLEQIFRHLPWSAYPAIYGNPQYFRNLTQLARRAGPRQSATKPGAGGGQVTYHLRPLSRERVASLRALARPFGATINDLFVTAMFRGLAQAPRASDEMCVTQAVDLRRYLPRGQRAEAICNLTGAEFLTLRDAGDCFEETLKRVVALTRTRKASYIGLNGFIGLVPLVRGLPPFLMQKAMRMGIDHVMQPSSFPSLLTNGGRILPAATRFDAPAHSAWMLHVPLRSPVFLVGLSGHDETLMLTAGTNIEAAEAASARLDSVLMQLPA
jgi:NRPS condensation-like uncharacterized protein